MPQLTKVFSHQISKFIIRYSFPTPRFYARRYNPAFSKSKSCKTYLYVIGLEESVTAY